MYRYYCYALIRLIFGFVYIPTIFLQQYTVRAKYLTDKTQNAGDASPAVGQPYLRHTYERPLSFSQPAASLPLIIEPVDYAIYYDRYNKRTPASNGAESNNGGPREIRSPLGTMRFGKRNNAAANPLGTMRFGKRGAVFASLSDFAGGGGAANMPMDIMRFGKRDLFPAFSSSRAGAAAAAMDGMPLRTMRFGKKTPIIDFDGLRDDGGGDF